MEGGDQLSPSNQEVIAEEIESETFEDDFELPGLTVTEEQVAVNQEEPKELPETQEVEVTGVEESTSPADAEAAPEVVADAVSAAQQQEDPHATEQPTPVEPAEGTGEDEPAAPAPADEEPTAVDVESPPVVAADEEPTAEVAAAADEQENEVEETRPAAGGDDLPLIGQDDNPNAGDEFVPVQEHEEVETGPQVVEDSAELVEPAAETQVEDHEQLTATAEKEGASEEPPAEVPVVEDADAPAAVEPVQEDQTVTVEVEQEEPPVTAVVAPPAAVIDDEAAAPDGPQAQPTNTSDPEPTTEQGEPSTEGVNSSGSSSDSHSESAQLRTTADRAAFAAIVSGFDAAEFEVEVLQPEHGLNIEKQTTDETPDEASWREKTLRFAPTSPQQASDQGAQSPPQPPPSTFRKPDPDNPEIAFVNGRLVTRIPGGGAIPSSSSGSRSSSRGNSPRGSHKSDSSSRAGGKRTKSKDIKSGSDKESVATIEGADGRPRKVIDFATDDSTIGRTQDQSQHPIVDSEYLQPETHSLTELGRQFDLESTLESLNQPDAERTSHKELAAKHKNVKSKITVLSPEVYESKNCKALMILRKHTVQAVTDFFHHLYEPIAPDGSQLRQAWQPLGKSYEDKLAEKRVLAYMQAKNRLEKRQKAATKHTGIPDGVDPEQFQAYLARKEANALAVRNRMYEALDFEETAKRREQAREKEMENRRAAYTQIANELLEAKEYRTQLLQPNTATERHHGKRPDSPLNKDRKVEFETPKKDGDKNNKPAAGKVAGRFRFLDADAPHSDSKAIRGVLFRDRGDGTTAAAERDAISVSPAKEKISHWGDLRKNYYQELPKIYESAEQKLDKLSAQLDKRLHRCIMRVSKVSPGKKLAPISNSTYSSSTALSTEQMIRMSDNNSVNGNSRPMMRGNFSANHPIYDPSNFNGGTNRDRMRGAGGGGGNRGSPSPARQLELLT
ncbi:unnamed protein product [Amoebophrya sp. A120]|nr:unnamed protein product [Amoebophrya sp. A120]|eukprot:GSA120T00014041001.1